jgi:HAD superfamily hydrolase (TIGR01509 family)
VLHHRGHWIFDMDGTLTVPAHDFAAARRALGVPPGADILAHLAALAPREAAEAEAWLAGWEQDIADHAAVQDDARALVEALHARGARLGILTRNTVPVARRTLRAIGMSERFDPAVVLGRESAAPKPAPDGVLRILAHWGAEASDAVVVGDYLHDVRAGRAAGTATVLVNRRDEPGWHDEADLVLRSLAGLAAEVEAAP